MISMLTLLACGPKKVDEAPPPIGWHSEEGWTGACYYGPNWSELQEKEGLTARKQARQDGLNAVMSQWRGERGDGVSFDDNTIMDAETALLGFPNEIEAVVDKNLAYCKQVMGAGGSTGEWNSWLKKLPDQLMEGVCMQPLDYTLFDYLDIGRGWQLEVPVCEGNVVNISGTLSDQFRISDEGEWMTVEGDMANPAVGTNYPCNFEGCYAGQLIARFTSDDGIENIFPVGGGVTWTAPAHGVISVRINDDTFYDNTWYQSGSIIDHAGITIGPPVE